MGDFLFKNGDIVRVHLREGEKYLTYGGDNYGIGKKATVEEVCSPRHIKIFLDGLHTFYFNVHPGELSLCLTTNKEAKEYLRR